MPRLNKRSFQPDVIGELLDYVVTMPPEDATHKIAHKYASFLAISHLTLQRYPFVACEVLASEQLVILEGFFPLSNDEDDDSGDEDTDEMFDSEENEAPGAKE